MLQNYLTFLNCLRLTTLAVRTLFYMYTILLQSDCRGQRVPFWWSPESSVLCVCPCVCVCVSCTSVYMWNIRFVDLKRHVNCFLGWCHYNNVDLIYQIIICVRTILAYRLVFRYTNVSLFTFCWNIYVCLMVRKLFILVWLLKKITLNLNMYYFMSLKVQRVLNIWQ